MFFSLMTNCRHVLELDWTPYIIYYFNSYYIYIYFYLHVLNIIIYNFM